MRRNPVYSLLKFYVIGVIILLALVALTANRCSGQELKKHIAPAVLVFVSGAFEGVQDWSAFHNSGGSQFWDGSVSWKNKYKNHDPSQGKTFAGKYFVFLTDGFHLMKFSKNLTLFSGFALYSRTFQKGKKWYWYIIEGAAYWAINRIGFNMTYNLLK